GLVSALAVLADRFSQRLGLGVSERISPDLPSLPAETELVVYRVAQEALTNVARHSRSRRAELTLDCDRERVTLGGRDSGRGLPDGNGGGTGRRGMHERATLIGASLEIGNRHPQPGCEVRLEVPIGGRQ